MQSRSRTDDSPGCLAGNDPSVDTREHPPTGTPGAPADSSSALPRRVEFWGDPPTATVVVALAFAVVQDRHGRILLVRRVDTGNWELPGGRIEPGETASAAAIREVTEETGLTVSVTGLAGVFCDPGHVVVYPATHEARQQHVTLVHAVSTGPAGTDVGHAFDVAGLDQDEIDDAGWVELDQLSRLRIHPSVHRRIDHALRHHRGEARTHVD